MYAMLTCGDDKEQPDKTLRKSLIRLAVHVNYLSLYIPNSHGGWWQ